MSTRPFPNRRTALVVAALAAALLAPSAAAADPAALNRDPCSVLLQQAARFPGGFETDTGTVRLVSDGYVSHLMSQPPCRTTGE